jgi:hypothetical protein
MDDATDVQAWGHVLADPISRERVTRGAAWLDKVAPGWERKLDLSILDIEDGAACVCGQVFMAEAVHHINGYAYACDFLSASSLAGWPDGPTRRGVMASHGFLFSEDGDAWVALVKERFETGALSDTA